MSADFLYTLEVILNGLMAGVMYSLVALGFVLTLKLPVFLTMLKV